MCLAVCFVIIIELRRSWDFSLITENCSRIFFSKKIKVFLCDLETNFQSILFFVLSAVDEETENDENDESYLSSSTQAKQHVLEISQEI